MDGFIIIGNMNAITYKEIFPYLKDNKMWLGYHHNVVYAFETPYTNNQESNKKVLEGMGLDPAKHILVKGISWFTNLEHSKRKEYIGLTKKYNPTDYPKYDNYDAIEVGRVDDIPKDYDGVMGVPITFLGKHNPKQFEIVGITENANYLEPLHINGCEKYDRPYLNGKRMYSRLLIRKVKELPTEEEVKNIADFIVVGNKNAITYKEIFPYLKDNKMWLGYNHPHYFEVPLDEVENEKIQYEEGGKIYQTFGNISWFTNLEHNKRKELIGLTKKYNSTDYPKYDNYDAIEVSKVTDIPKDYDGVMGVPITYLDKHNPNQFEILGCTERWSEFRTKKYTIDQYASANDLNATWVVLNNNTPKTGYKRLLIRKIKELPTEEEDILNNNKM